MRQEVLICCGWAVLTAALAGCRQDPNIVLLRRDLRLHEDHIYDLEDALAQSEDRLASCHRENAALRRRLAAADGAPGESLPAPPKTMEPKAPQREPLPEFNGAGPPKIDLGTETTPEEIQPKSPPAGPPDEPKRLPKSSEQPPAAQTSPKRPRGRVLPASADADCPPVRSIVVNPRFTGGNDTDGKLGDEGILVLLETKGEDGRLVEAPGDLTLTILDPAESGERALVAQWDFTSDEMAQHFRRMRFGQGYVFELPWSGEPPKHEELTLRVRLTSLDGRTLTTQHDFKVEILGHDEFITRSVRAGRIRPWVPERGVETGTVPASHAKTEVVSEAPPLGDSSPGQPALRKSRPLWRPDR